MSEVRLRKVFKRYDVVEAVRGIDLDIADHEFVVLVGPSGCGKSTTLRMIAGLEDITGRRDLHRRRHRQRRAAERPRHRHGVPELRALPAHDRVRRTCRSGCGSSAFPRPRSRSAWTRPPASSTSRSCSTASPSSSRAASASASPWVAPSCAIPRCSCSTSRCRTSTPSSGCRCAPRSRRCTSRCAPRPSTSPTTRSRP